MTAAQGNTGKLEAWAIKVALASTATKVNPAQPGAHHRDRDTAGRFGAGN
jgi:hypothetical protein